MTEGSLLTSFVESIDQWQLIDSRKEVVTAKTDAAGFWRLPASSEVEREAAFETDKRELERLGKLKAAMGLWPREAVLHFYSPSALILGKLDRRLPEREQAFDWLEREEVPTVLRIAGGQAIVSDAEVLNISVLFAEPDQRFSIDDGFRLMAELIQEAWGELLMERLGSRPKELELEIGEIPRSYCPGDYDLSLQGRKVCGIAQRRVKHAMGVMAYISVSGDQDARCRLVRDFYDHGEADARFPASDPEVMTTLDSVLALKVEDLIERFQSVLGMHLPRASF